METPLQFPPGAITILKQSDNELEFDINQEWLGDVGIAIRNGEDCGIQTNVPNGALAGTYQGVCIENVASVTIVVYVDPEFDAGDCEACNTDTITDLGFEFCSYNIEIPCESTPVECGEPSASPSGSFYPSSAPTESPTKSVSPTASPTDAPSGSPTANPTASPTASPTGTPTANPTGGPTASPTASPTGGPTVSPTANPTGGPTASPTASPTGGPTSTPTASPTGGPTATPTASPTGGPTANPTASPTGGPTANPTASPTGGPTVSPTANPTVSQSPTGCNVPTPPEIIDAVCMTTGGEEMDLIDFPTGALDVSSYLDGSIDFQIIQQWQESAGVAYEVGMDNCAIKGNVPFDGTENLSADCIDGFASATVVVYLDDNFEPDECDACNVDDLAEMGGNSTFCAYRIEIACEPMVVECGEPSASPSGSYYPSSAPTASPTKSALPSASPTGSPTSAPTGPPTVSPTASPTASPTISPTASPTVSPTASPTVSPTDQTDAPTPEDSCPVPDAILVSVEGETIYPETDIPIKITFQNTTHVKFKVENTFDQTISAVYTQYHSGSFGETECLEESNLEVDKFAEADFTARCMHSTKISIVNLWIQDCVSTGMTFLNGADNAEIPECCHAGEECKTVMYTFKLPCVETCPTEGEPSEGGNDQRRRKAHEIIREKKALEGSTVEFEAITGHPEDNGSEDHFCVVEDYPCGPSHEKVHVCHYSARDGYKTFCVPESDSDALRFYPKDYCGPCVGGYATA